MATIKTAENCLLLLCILAGAGVARIAAKRDLHATTSGMDISVIHDILLRVE